MDKCTFDSYEVKVDYFPISTQEGNLNLDKQGTVVGVSVEITQDSADSAMKFGLGSQPMIQINQDEGARQFGGFEVHGVPCHYKGNLEWKFTSNNGPKGMIALYTITGKKKNLFV
jgi:hypothetical protein